MDTMDFPRLTFGHYRFHFTAKSTLQLPSYTGSTWRGALGHALRRTACVTNSQDCRGCMLSASCAHGYLFESPPQNSSGMLARSTAVPHPYVLRPSKGGPITAGHTHSLDVLLFGMGNRYLPYVLHALRQAAEDGLGRERGKMALDIVEQWHDGQWQPIFSPTAPLAAKPPATLVAPGAPERIRVQLHTPLRLRSNNRYVGVEQFGFAHLFSALMLRLSQLARFHGDGEPQADYAQLASLAREQRLIDTELRWQDWARYSSRQRTRMQMGGLLGQFTLTGEHLSAFWPWLWLGQYSHAGKACTMGLGQYRIDPI